jgi:radical SAM protein with 4Fe4S-binding SPASM domain
MTDYRLRELKIEINRDCPLNCLHCSSNGQSGAPERLSSHKITEIVKEFVSLGGEKVCISGGEPLCHKEINSIISLTKNEVIELSIYTTGIQRNGNPISSISKKTAEILAENHVKMIYSLHGARDVTHDRLTQVSGSFKSTITAIEKTIDLGMDVELHVVPMAVNYKELADITKIAAGLNIKSISWLRFVPQGRGLTNRGILQLTRDQLFKLHETKTKIKKINDYINIRTGSPFNILCPETALHCEAGINVLTIGPDGHISPCDAFKQFRVDDQFGNIFNNSLTDIWQKSSFLNNVRAIHEAASESKCTSCHLYSKCHSGCLAQKAILNGILSNDEDPLCPMRYSIGSVNDIKAIAV